jgi:hypothetical protein
MVEAVRKRWADASSRLRWGKPKDQLHVPRSLSEACSEENEEKQGCCCSCCQIGQALKRGF